MIFTICPAKSLYNTEKNSRLIDQKTKGELTLISCFDTCLAEGSKDLYSNKLDSKEKKKTTEHRTDAGRAIKFCFLPTNNLIRSPGFHAYLMSLTRNNTKYNKWY